MILVSAYTDIGNPETPRGFEPELLGVELAKRGMLSKVLCRGVSRRRPSRLERGHVVTPLPFGNLLPRMLFGITLITQRVPVRYIGQNILYDRFAARYIDRHPGETDVLLCCNSSLTCEIAAAKRQGMKVFVIASTGHMEYVRTLMTEEYAKYGLTYNVAEYVAIEEADNDSYREADLIFARSEYVRRTLIENGIPATKISTEPIHMYANLDRFRPAKKRPDRFRVVFVGMVSFWKGVHYLLEAWEQLMLRDAELVLCGTVEEKFKKTFPRYWNEPSIRFLGHVDPLPHLQGGSILVFPSLSEGCPQAVIEAMACGLPCIVTEHSGSVVRDGIDGYVVPIRDSDAIAERIRFFHEHPGRAKTMGENSHRRAQAFSTRRYAARFAEIVMSAAQDDQ